MNKTTIKFLFLNVCTYTLMIFAAGCSEDETETTKEKDPPFVPNYEFTSVEYRERDFGSSGPYRGWSTELSTKTVLVDNIENYTPPLESIPLNSWGSRTDVAANTNFIGKEGFFRVGKHGLRWYFIDPENGVNIIRGTQHVRPGKKTAAVDMSPEQISEYGTAFASDQTWASATSKMLVDNNMNFVTYGAKRVERFPAEFENELLRPSAEKKLAYAENLYLLRTFMWDMHKDLGYTFDSKHNRLVLVFHPTFKSYVEKLAKEKCAPFKDDTHFVGYFLDNELPFAAYSSGGPAQGIDLASFLAIDDNRYFGARNFAIEFMKERGKSANDEVTSEDRDAFRTAVSHEYFRITADAVRKADPNHLILGARLHDSSKYNKGVIEACGTYCDVISINYYHKWEPEASLLLDIETYGQAKPFFVTEFYVRADGVGYNGHIYDNKDGGGWLVRDQKSRGYFYQNFCIKLIESKNCVGWSHFEYADSYGVYSGTTKIESNKGLVSVKYEPYQDFLGVMKQLHDNVYGLADFYDK